MHSTKSFSMNGKEGRGDTSVWTDTSLDRAQKAQQRSVLLLCLVLFMIFV
jgi:hypothetical protein